MSLLLPETRALSAVDLRDVVDGVELRALGLIGYLPLTSLIVLNLRPKFPIDNLWHMLSIADEAYDRILPILRSYETANVIAPHQLLARGFCHYLRQILNVGLTRSYYPEPYHGHFKPKMNFGQTMGRYLSRGDDVNVMSDVFSFSAKLRVNGILKSACLAFLRLIPRSDRWAGERYILVDALSALQRVAVSPMRYGEQALSDTVPAWIRDSYGGALNIYAVLLGFTKIGFSYNALGSEMPSFLFSLDSVFESYVRNTFRMDFRERAISVLDGNLPKNQGFLFQDSRRFPIKPDMIFRKGKLVKAIGEVKYKPRIEEADRYQVISHVVATGAPVGFWVSPALSTEEAGRDYIGSIATGAKFFHYKLDISGDLAATAHSMTSSIAQLL